MKSKLAGTILHRFLLALAGPAFTLSLAPVHAAEAPNVGPKPPTATVTAQAKASAVVTVEASQKALIFRNVRSWKREVDFEEMLMTLGVKFEVKPSREMAATDLSPYGFVIIPGAQWGSDYYRDYADSAARFDRYVTNGGALVLELNGAEQHGITLPRGASMVKHGATDNVITSPGHPIMGPLSGKGIHATYASHGWLAGVPKDAHILATEGTEEAPAPDKPTFVEYAHGAGRVIAACQCFHDRDGSGRGPLMETVLTYASDRQWFSPRK